MKKFIIQSVLLILVIGLGIFLASPKSSKIELPFLPQQPHFANLAINDKTIKVELADTQEKRKKGLALRDSLAENEGMLFIFPKSDKYPFWMKGLKFALDFVWIREDQVVDILTNIQPPQAGQDDSSLPIYSSSSEVDKVLELPAGSVEKLNIKVGDTVKID